MGGESLPGSSCLIRGASTQVGETNQDNACGVEGQLTLSLQQRQDLNGLDVSITSSRPVHASRVFVGKRVDEVLQTLPLLYGVCGQAQAVAAVRALESATGLDWERRGILEAKRQRLLMLESLREHLLRVLVDWSGFLNEPVNPKHLMAMTRAIQTLKTTIDPYDTVLHRQDSDGHPQWVDLSNDRALQSLLVLMTDGVFGTAPQYWVEQALAGESPSTGIAGRFFQALNNQAWAGLAGTEPVEDMEVLDSERLVAQLAGNRAQQFIEQPTWLGACRETGALSRQCSRSSRLREQVTQRGKTLSLRALARLLELHQLWLDLSQGAPESLLADVIAADQGLSQVEAARGRLVHRAVLEGERVAEYQILAPTEWNFHPQGALARNLAQISRNSPREMACQAALLINVIDPCVAYRLEWTGPDGQAEIVPSHQGCLAHHA